MKEQTLHIVLRQTDGGKWLAYFQNEKYKGKYYKDPVTAIMNAVVRRIVPYKLSMI